MKQDAYGQTYFTESSLADALYQKPDLDFGAVSVLDPVRFNAAVRELHLDWPILTEYQAPSGSIEQFDHANQQCWFMPEYYVKLDIAAWVLGQCSSQAELQRVGQELLLYQDRNLFPLLCYLKYLVDVMRENNIVWGVGRGSSVASYVLYLIGIHRINSLYYGLDIEEFLKG